MQILGIVSHNEGSTTVTVVVTMKMAGSTTQSKQVRDEKACNHRSHATCKDRTPGSPILFHSGT